MNKFVKVSKMFTHDLLFLKKKFLFQIMHNLLK